MSTTSDVTVKLDDRVRLMSALLAATQWPDKAQERKPHGTHAHARATRKHLTPYRGHEAVQVVQHVLDQGAPLEALFTLALRLTWPGLEIDGLPRWIPPTWPASLRDFMEQTSLSRWWQNEDYAWQKSLSEASKPFQGVNFRQFLKPFLGDIHESLLFIPNISYPSDQEIGVRLASQLVCIAPPRLAWGDSPPWPFDEDPAYLYRTALGQYGRLLMIAYLRQHAEAITEATQTPLPIGDQLQALFPTWHEQFTHLFVAGAAVIYLEDHLSAAEANAFVVMERKAQGMSILPGVVSVLRRYLSEKEAGRYTSLVDFLPVFPKQLRVAKRIVSL